MNITLYTNKSDSNYVDKTITSLTTTTGVLKESTSVTDPVILLSGIDSYVSTCNYMYIQELGRYYYVTDIVSVNNGLWELRCHVDVLMSYKTKIRQQSGIIARQEFNTNTYLSDPRLKVQANPYVQQIEFSDGFESAWSYVLAVVGN